MQRLGGHHLIKLFPGLVQDAGYLVVIGTSRMVDAKGQAWQAVTNGLRVGLEPVD